MRSAGSEALRRIAERDTQVEVAARLSARLGKAVAQARVSSWTLGARTPSAANLVAIQLEYGIEPVDWTQPPYGEAPPPIGRALGVERRLAQAEQEAEERRARRRRKG